MDTFSEQQLRRRLLKIESRLATLEEVLGAEPPPEPVPVLPPEPRREAVRRPAPPPVPAPTLPEPRARERKAMPLPPTRSAGELERAFGVAVLGRIGVAAVLLTAAYFAQLTWREMSPVVRVFAIYGLAGAFVGAGFLLRGRVAKKYVGLLWGGGAAAAYLAGITARLTYDLVGPWVAMAMLIAAAALGQYLARRLRHPIFASTALAGAVAAPLLVGDASDHRTFLLAYLLLLNGWAAWTERRWGWWTARLVALVGAGIVIAKWVYTHGAVDVSTFVHVHLYLVGFALPELIAVARRARVEADRLAFILGAVAAASLVLWVLTIRVLSDMAMPGFGWIAGVLWVGIGLALHGRAWEKDRFLPRGLVTIGGMLFVLGCLGAPGVFDATGTAASVAIVSTLAVAALALLALRQTAGAGDAAVSLAAVIAPFAVFAAGDPAASLRLALVGLVPAASMVVFGRGRAARVIGVLAGTVTLAFGAARGAALDPYWAAGGIAAGAAWVAVCLRLSTTRRDAPAASASMIAALLLGLLWAGAAFGYPLVHTEFPLFDRLTLAGIALAGVAWWFADVRRKRVEGGTQTGLLIVALGVAILAGWREVAGMVVEAALPARNAAHIAYLGFAGLGLAVLGVDRRLPGVRGTGIALVLAACGKTLLDVRVPETSGWAAAGLMFAAVAISSLSLLVTRRTGFMRTMTVPGLVLLGLAWCAHALGGTLPADTPIVNARFFSGLFVLGSFAAAAWSRRGVDGAQSTDLLGLGLLLGYGVGLAELLDAVEGLGQAWPDVLVSVYTTLYAAGLLFVGFRIRERRLRYPALAVFLIVVLKVGFHDLAAAGLSLRIFVTGVLGLVLLCAAYAYARRREGRPAAT